MHQGVSAEHSGKYSDTEDGQAADPGANSPFDKLQVSGEDAHSRSIDQDWACHHEEPAEDICHIEPAPAQRQAMHIVGCPGVSQIGEDGHPASDAEGEDRHDVSEVLVMGHIQQIAGEGFRLCVQQKGNKSEKNEPDHPKKGNRPVFPVIISYDRSDGIR